MAFDNPIARETKCVNAVSLSAASTRVFRGPKGRRGRLVDILGSVTTTVVGTTSGPRLQLGVSGALTQFADVVLANGTAAGTALVGSVLGGLKSGVNGASLEIPADTDITFGVIAAVGTPAGVADVELLIEWY
jgi:hypothetical protein